MSPKTEKTINKILSYVQEIHDCYSGKIQEITISQISKEELKEIRQRIGYKITSMNLGFFAFRIKYTVDGNSPRYLMGLPVDFGGKSC